MQTKNFCPLLCIAALLLGASNPAPGQTKADTLPRRYWEVGLDVLSLFEKNNVPAASALFRYNYDVKKNTGRAWVGRLGLEAEDRTLTIIGGHVTGWQRLKPSLGIGHEWQRRGRHFRVSWGAMATAAYSDAFDDNHLLFDGDTFYLTDTKTKEWNFGLSGFVGFQYQITPHLALSAESALLLNARRHDYEDARRTWPEELPGFRILEKERTLTLETRPIYTLNLVYAIPGKGRKKDARPGVPPDAAPRQLGNSWEIGLDALALFDKNDLPATSLFARYNYAQTTRTGKAWRARLGFTAETGTRELPLIWSGKETRDAHGPYLSLGHEWQRKAGRFRCFWGGDVSLGYYRLHHKILGYPYILGTQGEVAEGKEIELGAYILMGGQYALNDRLSLSIESTIRGDYYWSHYIYDLRDLTGPPNDINGDDRERSFYFKVSPFQTINLIFSLNNN